MSVTSAVARDDARAPGAIAFSGPDAATFLQGQLTCDVRLLAHDGVMLGACLSPQGRVLAVLRLIRRPEGLVGLLPQALAQPVIAHLSRYRLRAKLTIEDLSPRLNFARAFGAGDVAHRLDGTRSRVTLPGGRELWIDTSAIAEALRAGEDAWHAAAIGAGDAQVTAESSGEYVPQMLNLDLRDGISFGKGCYTGQESWPGLSTWDGSSDGRLPTARRVGRYRPRRRWSRTGQVWARCSSQRRPVPAASVLRS
jgi:folate-binding protein YgfZ